MRTVRDDGVTICSCCSHQIPWSVSRCEHCYNGEWLHCYYEGLASIISHNFSNNYIRLNDFVDQASHVIDRAKTEFNYYRVNCFPQLTWENFLRDNPNIESLIFELKKTLELRRSNWQKEGF